MNTNDLCTEEQAIALAGVSARTLQRFCESGYLTTSQGADGKVRYARTQLREIFGSHDTNEELPESDNTEDTDLSLGSYYAETESTVEPRSESATAAETPQNRSETTTRGRFNQQSEIEIERLKSLLAIQERMLDAKDDEIADLKNQRAWLRERIEKLEEKSDRDQILLLSETQTIRSLLAYQESRKSGFRQFLEWVGVVPTPELKAISQSHTQPPQTTSSGRTIEIRKASNAN